MSTGGELEGTVLGFLDDITAIGDPAISRQQKVLGVAAQRLLGELREVYSKYENKGTGAYQAQQLYARLRNLKDLVPPKEAKALTETFKGDLAKAYEKGSDTAKGMAEILKATPETLKKTAKPNIAAMNAAGIRLENFWRKENSDFRDRVTALTQTALAQGQGYRKLSLQIRELLVLERDSGRESQRSERLRKRMGIAGRAELIARTELQTAGVQGKLASIRKMGYEWARWSATGERSCPFCISRDGLLYTVDDIEGAIPAHPRCRCSLIPADPPDNFKNKRFEDKGLDAAESLDDAYWAKSRAKKIREFQANNPKIGNSELRRYAKTPTNAQKFLRPGSPAPEPQWAPSGQLIPNLERVVLNSQRLAERAKLQDKKAEEQKRLEREAKAAEQNAIIEAKKRAEAERLIKEAREEAERQRAAEEAAAKEKAAAEAKKKAEAAAKKKAEDAKKTAEVKSKNSELIKKAKAEFERDIDKALKQFPGMSRSQAIELYKRAAKETGYSYKKGRANEDLEDDFIILFGKYKREVGEKFKAERKKLSDDIQKLKGESAERIAKEKAREADIVASKKPAPTRGKDGLDDKAKYMTGKTTKYPGDDISKWTTKQLKDVVALIPRKQTQIEFNRLIKAGKFAEVIDDLSYALGVAVNDNDWAIRINSQLKSSDIYNKMSKQALKDAFEKVHSPKMGPNQMDEWLTKADGRVGGKVMSTKEATGFTLSQMGKYWDDLIKAGGSTSAVKAMTKMMRESDLLIVWGKNGERATSEMKNDPRITQWEARGSKNPIPPSNANGWTSASSQVVGMKHRPLREDHNVVFEPAKANMTEWKKIIDNYLQKSIDHYVTSKGKDYDHLKIDGKWRENFSTTSILTEMGLRAKGNTTELLANMHMSTLVHELGHQMQWYLEKRSLGQARPYPAVSPGLAKLTSAEKRSGTEYSKSNEFERFAEDWVLYTVSPDLFRVLKPKTAKQLDDLIENLFTKDHYGQGPTIEQILAQRPAISTQTGESVVSGVSNPTTEDF